MPQSIVFLETFENVGILLRKRISLSSDISAELAQPRYFKLETLNVSLLTLAIGSITSQSELILNSTIDEERRTSTLAYSSQPKERIRVLF